MTAFVMNIGAGTKLGRYEIRSKIGEGGMGEVYLAQDTKLDRRVALKILPANVADFENLTHDQNTEYLSDGVTESLINSLSQLSMAKLIGEILR